MKRLNLNETWVLCLKMWKWIAKQVKAGRQNVEGLKEEWLRKHKFSGIHSKCFFCDYAVKNSHPKKFDCNCPAERIEQDFWCQKDSYCYSLKPIAFYKKLVELNKLRLKKR